MDTPSRLLRLLSLLSSRAWWSAAELAAETGVTERTVRRDITRLRDLGYPVEATTGRYGGYTLGRGGRLPPLVLDDDEAVAVAIGLRAAAGGATGAESAALSALAKLDQVLPVRLREQVAALAAVTVGLRAPASPRSTSMPWSPPAWPVGDLSGCASPTSTPRTGATDRLVEPYRLVYTERSWYLVAFDPSRDDWRTFRVDRMTELHLTGVRFTAIDDPPDAVALVSRGVAVAAYDLQVEVRLRLPLGRGPARHGPAHRRRARGRDRPGSCIARIGGDADWIARYLAGLDVAVRGGRGRRGARPSSAPWAVGSSATTGERPPVSRGRMEP